MSCYHPQYAYIAGQNDEGKNIIKFCNEVTEHGHCDVNHLKRKYGKDLLAIPCGRCVGCKLDYSRSWAVRCVLESLDFPDNSFLTLTYEKAPPFLIKKDLSDFIKRLRNAHPDIKIRFFGCGEYGSKNDRPHFHVLIFGYGFPDKKLIKSYEGSNLYQSQELSKLWKFGLSSIGEVCLKSCAYVARYTSKKVGSSRGDEFVLMSRRPGIGAKFFYDKKDLIYLTDTLYGNFGSSHKARVPRYYDKLAEKEGIDLTKIKDERIRRANNFMNLGKYLHGFGDDIPLNNLLDGIANMKFNLLKRGI